MPTNREIYFKFLAINEYLNKNVVTSLLMEANGFESINNLLFSFDDEVVDLDKTLDFLEKAKNGVPYQYIINKASFLENDFYVNESVLIPRQETEQLVLDALNTIPNNYIVCDLCTGSGAIAISLKKKNPTLSMLASDIDENALNVANKNASIHKVDIDFYQGDLIEPLVQKNIKIDVLICNPPYIESQETISKQTWDYEPHLALLASPSTLFYERIFRDYRKIMNERFMMFFEIGEEMVCELEALVKQYLPEVKYNFYKDLYNKFRFLHIIK